MAFGCSTTLRTLVASVSSLPTRVTLDVGLVVRTDRMVCNPHPLLGFLAFPFCHHELSHDLKLVLAPLPLLEPELDVMLLGGTAGQHVSCGNKGWLVVENFDLSQLFQICIDLASFSRQLDEILPLGLGVLGNSKGYQAFHKSRDVLEDQT